MTDVTVRLKEASARKLDRLAAKLDQSPSYLAEQAIDDFLDREEWQLAEIEAGLAEAEQGEFASSEDVATVVARYVQPAKSA